MDTIPRNDFILRNRYDAFCKAVLRNEAKDYLHEMGRQRDREKSLDALTQQELDKSNIPYTRVRNSITAKMDAIALDFCIEMEKNQIVCVPIPTNESQWDKNTNRWRSIVSQKHIAQAAGLGTIGRHSLLITLEFGSMVWLGAVLCEQNLEPDKMKEPLCNNCNLCVDICPVNALENPEIKQQSCWDFAFGDDEEEQVWRIACHRCRDICPYNLGSQNSILRKNT